VSIKAIDATFLYMHVEHHFSRSVPHRQVPKHPHAGQARGDELLADALTDVVQSRLDRLGADVLSLQIMEQPLTMIGYY
jgi:hypothetical protein